MKWRGYRLGCWAALLALAACSRSVPDQLALCPPDYGKFSRLEDLARDNGPAGVRARSAIRYIRSQKLPTTGYYLAKVPTSTSNGKLEYDLLHDSGFAKPCRIGNQSGSDGVLEVDATTQEVKGLLFSQ
jgi:hypothetical protein